MADNIKTPAGGATDPAVGTDEIGGVHYQVVKQAFGDPDSVTQVSAANPLPVENQDAPAVLSGSLSGNGVLLTCDTSGFQVISLQLTGIWEALIFLQVSNDNVNWEMIQAFSMSTGLSASDNISENDLILIPCAGRYFQAVVQNYSNGTINATAYLRNQTLAGIGEAMLSQAMDQRNCTPMGVAPMGLTQPGSQPVVNSVPVALAQEQINDLIIQSGPKIGRLGENILTPTGGPIDCLQYRSIALQVNTQASATGAIIFEGSNDGVNFTFVSMYDAAALTTIPVNSFSLAASTVRYFIAPLYFRYFRARISTVLGGNYTAAFTILRMAAFSLPQTQNINAIGGTAPVTAGVAGTLAVGGNVAPAALPTLNPLTVGGVDVRGLIRRVLTDSMGNSTAVGPDPLQMGSCNPVLTRDAVSGYGADTTDILLRMLIELRSMALYLKEMPLYLNQGKAIDDEIQFDMSDEIRLVN
jgi:hypothetical protein